MKFLFTLLLLGFCTLAFAKHKDVITLNNNLSFVGKVKKIDNCYIRFKTKDGKYFIPTDHILSLTFGDKKNNLQQTYNDLTDAAKCKAAESDAKLYHGKASGHVALGVFTGPFGLIGAAVANPSPRKGKNTIKKTNNGTLLTDPVYLKCYKKKAKAKNVGNTAIGFAAWAVALLFI